MLLEVKNLNTCYGTSHILFDVSIEVNEGEVICILGRNGVGKSTLLKSIMGLAAPRSGTIAFSGKKINGRQPFQIARTGIGFVPEDRIIFPDLTVKENMEMGQKKNGYSGPWTFDRVYSMFPILNDRQAQMAGTLSGGEQQMLTIARTLMGNPGLLLLDEPTEGLSPLIVKELAKYVYDLKKEGMPILLAEQNSGFALGISNRCYILEKGAVRWQGGSTELKEKPEILKTYLGV